MAGRGSELSPVVGNLVAKNAQTRALVPSPLERERRPVRGVIFDLFGTLTDGALEDERDAHYARLAHVLEVPHRGFVEMMRGSFRRRFQGEFGGVAQTLRRIGRDLGTVIRGRQLREAVQLRLLIERRLASPRVDAIPLLKELRRRGLAVAVISDCGPETPQVWPALPFATLVDRCVFSCEVGVCKPDPAIYGLALDQLGLRADQCLYVGDGGSRELTGALAVGMRAVRLAVTREGGERREARFDPEVDWTGPTVGCLSDLLDFPGFGSSGGARRRRPAARQG